MFNQSCVLIITDNLDEPSSYVSYLEQHFAFVLTCCANDVLTCLAKFRPDIILLHDLPNRIDACNLCQRIRADQNAQHLPIVILSESADSERYVQAFEANADDFLFAARSDLNELAHRLRARLAARAGEQQLHQHIATQNKLIRTMAHDLRSALTILTLNAHLLQARLENQKADRYLNKIRSQIDYLAYSLDNIVNMVATSRG